MKFPAQPIYKLKGVIRNYDWGGYEFIPQLLSQNNPEKKPVAEYWLGAHASASSRLLMDGDEILLEKFIALQPELLLGKNTAKKFHRLPFLLKVLDVRDMLSIQVHPSKYEAEKGFARENKEGISIDAPHRNYKDDNHKPELMVALSEFWLLHGFKPADELSELLSTVAEFRSLHEIFSATGYDQLYKTVMEMPQQSVNELLKPLLERIISQYQQGQFSKSQPDYWAAKAALSFTLANNIDRGIFSIYFLNLIHLKKGEGIFQDAGVLHAYLEGQNVEIMASSDNVLRGGLTTKHIDVKELMKHVKFEETRPAIIHGQNISSKEIHYPIGAPDFKLSRLVLNRGEECRIQTNSAEIILVLQGEAKLSSKQAELKLAKGGSAFLKADEEILISATAEADMIRASVPVHTSE